MKKYIFPGLIASLVLVGCTVPATTEPVTQQPIKEDVIQAPVDKNKLEVQNPGVSADYSLMQVAKHNTKDDCWLILDGGVYDVTSFIPKHPGGDKILRGCGKDATQMFAKHPESAKAMKEQFKIGELTQ